jgi:hypothetical protein
MIHTFELQMNALITTQNLHLHMTTAFTARDTCRLIHVLHITPPPIYGWRQVTTALLKEYYEENVKIRFLIQKLRG